MALTVDVDILVACDASGNTDAVTVGGMVGRTLRKAMSKLSRYSRGHVTWTMVRVRVPLAEKPGVGVGEVLEYSAVHAEPRH